MAAEVPVSDVLCEAMEYLSKLGLNLRDRSENLREKRIRKDKLKNAHAVHKAATKVLLICELSKKSLDNVETGVRKVLSIVDASQAPSDVGGKTKDKKKLDTSKKTFYSFEYESYKLRMSKKISLKHFTSAKVLAKRLPNSIRDKYPVYYDCKLKRLRKRLSEKSCSKRKSSVIHSDSNLDSESSCVSQRELVEVESDKTESNKNSNTSQRNSIVHDITKSNRRKSHSICKVDESCEDNKTNSETELNTDEQSSDGVKNKNQLEVPVADESVNNTNLLAKLADSSVKEGEKSVDQHYISGKQNNCSKKEGSLTLLFKKSKNIKESNKNEASQCKSNSEENGNKKKLNEMLNFDDSSDGDKESGNNKSKETKQKGNELHSSEDSESGSQNSHIREPKAKKTKLDDIACDSQLKADSDQDTAKTKSDDNQKDVDTDKPMIRCVNITKLLKPDVLKTKSSKSIIEEARKNIIFLNKEDKSINSIKHQNLNDRKQSRSSVDINKDNVEYWAHKKKELDNFKPKQFTINIERLPKISINFLLNHKLKIIVQGSKTICEVPKGKENNIDEVKNALLNESESEESYMTAQAKKVKDSLLNDSESDKNEEHTEKENNPQSTNSNTRNTAKEAEKIKNALLYDSDSDKNEDEVVNKERIPTATDDLNDVNSDDHNSNKDNDSLHNNDDTNKPEESTQDPMKVKSSLLKDSSDSRSESLGRTKKKIRHKKKSMQAKKMLLYYSSSSENSENSEEKSKKHRLRQGRKKTCISSTSSGDDTMKNDDSSSNSSRAKKKAKIKHSDKECGISIDQIDGTVDEHSNSSVSKMVRSKAKPSGSSCQNSDNQDASDKVIDGLTNLNSLNKSQRRRGSSNNTESRSSVNKSNRSEPTPVIGEDLLHAVSSSDASDDNAEDDIVEELPKIHGLNGDSISHLAKDDLLGDSDSSVSHDKEPSDGTQNQEESEEEENVKLKRRKAANAISSDSEGGTSRRKQQDEDVRVSDFEDSDDSSTSTKRTKRKKKVSESDGSAGSSNDGGKKKRRRIKQLKDSEGSGSDTENEGRNKHGRKNIRKVMGKNQLEEATKKAAREEKERIARISDRQKLYNNLDFDETGKPDEVVLEKVVLDFDPETKEPLIEVDRGLVKKLKPHQANGIKFMWDACFESAKRIKKDRGSGCILAHCMGLGKTLQVISLTHTLLTHGHLTNVNRVLVVCPLSTVLNWVNEIRMWLKHAVSDFEVDIYELSRYKQNSERAFQLQQWLDNGGVCVLGYEMFRNLSADNNKKFKKKMLRSFQESLVDPGPDLVVCDEGHLLKNEKTSLSQSMNRVKTRRRIVLTGTPLQNNLKEYYCMVQFVKPNLLGKYNEYLNRFVNPITNGQYTDSTEHDIRIMKRRSHVLHKMLDGAVQRRDYGVLAPFLPPKHEYVLFITLTDIQVKLYQFYLDNYSRRPLPGKSGFLFPDFQSLQRIWTHPLVLKYNSERYEIMQQKKREREEEDSEGSLVDFIDDDSTPEETSTEESSDDLSDISDDSRKKSKKKKSAKKGKGKESKVGTRRGTRANPIDADDEDPDVAEVFEVKNENPTEWWIKLVEDEELDDMRNSHKLVLLFDILRQCEAIGDKLLVFSQSLYSLDLIEHFLGKVDEATQEGRIDEKLGGHVGSWSPGVDYFRLDGSTSCENRSIWCKNFNREDNPRARLFLISTRAGGLGINLVAANRVIIFDVSWNPSHDVQSIFRVYRFGQKKPCYVYRFLAMGTMEEKIYERQVTKQAISKRVIDEQQIDRHYAENDLAELYKFEARPDEPRPLPTLPKDRLFAEMLKEHEAQIYKYHEHDSLLENKEEETLSEEERKAAWEDFENEKNKPPPAPFPSAWPMHNGMVPGLLAQQQQQLAYAALAAMLRKDMPNINDNQIRDMLPLIYNSNPGLMQKMSEIYKYAQPGMMTPGMMNPVMNPAAGSGGGAGGMGGASGLQYEPPWQRQHQQQQQMRLQQLMQQNQQMGAKFYAGGLGSRDPVAMALQQQRAREIMMGGAGRPRGRPPGAPRREPTPAAPHDVVNLDSD